jgi:hypothetical protein
MITRPKPAIAALMKNCTYFATIFAAVKCRRRTTTTEVDGTILAESFAKRLGM